jgi:glycosyltransferase involved in cell wall biosynthesis
MITDQPQLLLSLCMIVKNEAKNLSRCLVSAQPYVDEIIVVDTGSTDETITIAGQHGAKVFHFDWCDDFATARNYSLSKATGEWILVLDADEELVVENLNFRQHLSANPNIWQYNLILADVSAESVMSECWLNRLSRNLQQIRYKGRFHEHLVCTGTNQGLRANLEGVQIRHYGYAPAIAIDKIRDRNIPILESIRQQEGLNLMLLFALADMYETVDELEKAQRCYGEAFEQLFPHLVEGTLPQAYVFVPSMLARLGTQALNQQDYETVRWICQRGLVWFPDFPPLNYLAGLFVGNLGFHAGAAAYFQTCLQLGQDSTYYRGEPFDIGYII